MQQWKVIGRIDRSENKYGTTVMTKTRRERIEELQDVQETGEQREYERELQ